jgi:hypothetical protein
MERLRVIAIDQPGWVWRGAFWVMALILLLPIVVLVVIALLAGVIVFGTLTLASMALQRVRGIFGSDDGRENVRVIQRP